MDGVVRGDRRHAWLLMTGATAFVAIAAFAYKMYVIDAGGISFMTSDGEATTSTTTGTSTENCVVGMIPNAPEDTWQPGIDGALHPNAQAWINSSQEAIAILKKRLATAPCEDHALIRGHIEMHRGEVRLMRQGVIPLRPPYNYD